MQPEIHVLGISLKTFGIVFACGFIAAGAILIRRLRELGKPIDYAYEMAFAALIGGLVGSRVYYVVQNYSQVKHDLIGSLFSGSGLVWYGGVIGGAIAVCAWAAWRGMLNLGLLDLASVPLAMGYAIGRIGCQVSGDGDYGKVSSLPWAMGYPHGTVPRHPASRCSQPRSTRRSPWDSSRGGCGGCGTGSVPGPCSPSISCSAASNDCSSSSRGATTGSWPG